MKKQFIYHPDFEPMVIDMTDADGFFKKGWYDTPTKFPKKESKPAAKKAKAKKAEVDGTDSSN